MTSILAIDGAAVAGKMKRRALEARRFASVGAGDEESSSAIMKRRPLSVGVSEENCDGSSSQDLARYRGDPAHPRQDHPVAGEGGQPVFGRVGLPRSRQP